jgi:O-antigen/teichoic acid export membrane protein
MSRNTLIAGQAGISFAGFLFGQIVRFFFTMAVARLLGEEALGVYALAFGVMQIIEVFAVAGFDSAVLRFVNLYPKEGFRGRDTVGFALRSSVFVAAMSALFVILFSSQLSGLLKGGNLLRFTLISYAAAVPFNVAATLAAHALQGYRQLLPKVVAAQVITPIVMLLLTFALSYFAGRSPALLIPYTAASIISFFWIWRKLVHVTGTGYMDMVKAPSDRQMTAYALPLMGVSLLSMMAHWLDILLLGMLAGPIASGLYQPAARTAGILRAVLPAFAGIVAPLVAGIHAGNRSAETESLYHMTTRWTVLLVTPAAIFLMLLPEPVLALFGARFASEGSVLTILAATALVQALTGISGTVFAMTGHSRIILLNAIAGLCIQAAATLLLIPRYGITGAALAALLSMVLLSLFRYIEVKSVLKFQPLSAVLWKPALAGGLTALLLFLLRPWLLGFHEAFAVGIGIAVTSGCYLMLIIVMGLEEEDREIILKIMPFGMNKP